MASQYGPKAVTEPAGPQEPEQPLPVPQPKLDQITRVDDAWEQLQSSTASGSEAAGFYFIQRKQLHFRARSFIITNLSSHSLLIPETLQVIPASCIAFVNRFPRLVDVLSLQVYVAGTTGGLISMAVTQEALNPSPGLALPGAAASTVTANQGTPNAGGAQAWPVTDATTHTNLASIDAALGGGLPSVLDADNLKVAIEKSISLAVTGTFWQATQPVSGTFWQATQPVSFGNIANKTPVRLTSASTATGVIVAAAHVLKSIDVYNNNAATRYLHFYNKTTAPTLSTDTPLVTVELSSGMAIRDKDIDGFNFSTGIAYAMTTDNPAIPTTAGSTGDIQGTIGYV